MKNTLKFVLAAMLGSALTISTLYWAPFNNKVVKIEHVDATPTLSARYTEEQATTNAPLDFTVPAEKTTPAVVNITSTIVGNEANDPRTEQLPEAFRDFFGPYFDEDSGKPQVGTGSGVIISSDGYIVTNNHVIDNASDIEVALVDKRTYKAKLIGTDPSTDLALIKIAENDLTYITIGNSDNVKVGEWVLAVGNPFRLTSTVTAGIVSAIGRSIDILRSRAEFPIESFIQTDAAVNPGNSGGALVDLNGNLIGINTAIATRRGSYEGYSFAVPSNIVAKVVEDLLQYGKVQRGFIGATILGVNGTLAKDKNLTVSEGVYISDLTDNGAAKSAGIEVGDVVTRVDGIEVKDSPKLLELLGRKRPGDAVELSINRFGEEKTFEVILKSGEEIGGQFASSSNDQEEDITDVQEVLGVALEKIEGEQAESYGLDFGLQVKSIYDGKVKESTDLRKGFIITHVNRVPVESLNQFENVLKSAYRDNSGVMLQGRYPNNPKKYYYAFGMD